MGNTELQKGRLKDQLESNKELNRHLRPDEQLPENEEDFIRRELVKVSEQLKRCEDFPPSYRDAAIVMFKKQQEKLLEWLEDVEKAKNPSN